MPAPSDVRPGVLDNPAWQRGRKTSGNAAEIFTYEQNRCFFRRSGSSKLRFPEAQIVWRTIFLSSCTNFPAFRLSLATSFLQRSVDLSTVQYLFCAIEVTYVPTASTFTHGEIIDPIYRTTPFAHFTRHKRQVHTETCSVQSPFVLNKIEVDIKGSAA